MRRPLIFTALTLGVLGAAVVLVLNAGAPERLPPPDPATPITLADGTELPLAEFLARVERRQPLAPAPTGDMSAAPDGAHALPDVTDPADIERLKAGMPSDFGIPKEVWHAQFGPVFALAEEHLLKGHLDQAEALYLSIAKGEPGYAFAQRRLAWDVITLGHDDPRRGLSYANASLLATPFDGNAWQDFARVYGRSLGLPVD